MTPRADQSDPIDTVDRRVPAGDRPSRGGLPDFLTVEEAARVLRIGRTSAYLLAQRWCHTGGRDGLPVVRVGRLLRVPRRVLERLAGGELDAPRPGARVPQPSELGQPHPGAPSLPATDETTAPGTRPRTPTSTTRRTRARRDTHDTHPTLFHDAR
jgi:hypothetical protein